MQVSIRTAASILFTGAVLTIGCAATRDGGSGTGDPSTSTTTEGALGGPRERVVRASMRVEVDSVAEATSTLRAALDAREGYVASSSADDARAHLELRVPIGALSGLETELGAMGHLLSTREEVEDVTLAHADQQARLVSARAEEARLFEMFATRTDALADVLAVERELSRVREQIETLDAEQRVLGDQIAMARLSVDLERATPPFTSEPVAFVARAARSGGQVAATLGLATLGVVATVAPSAFLVLAIGWLSRALVRFLRARSVT